MPYVYDLQVDADHILEVTEHPQLFMVASNVEFRCKPHHNTRHGKGGWGSR